MVPMPAHSSAVASSGACSPARADPAGGLRVRASATLFGLLLVGLLAGCSGGGSSSGGGTTAPSSVTQVVGSAGGTVSLSDGSAVTFDGGALKDGTSVTLSSSSQLPNPLPEGAQLLSGSVTVQLSGGGVADVLGQGASITIDLPSAQSSLASRFLQLINPKSAFAQTGTANPYRFGVVTTGTSTGDSGGPLYGFDVSTTLPTGIAARLLIPVPEIVSATTPAQINAAYVGTERCYPTTLELYRVKEEPSLIAPPFDLIPLSEKIAPGKTPLILVHGIQFKSFCEKPHESTWGNVIGPLLNDPSFKPQFQIFSVHYDSTKSIYANGQALAKRLNTAFGATPVVVLAHSMGGLVARSALTPVPPDNFVPLNPDNFVPANIAGIVTLGTPHIGTPIASVEGHTAVKKSGVWKGFLFNRLVDIRAEGYLDLAYDQPGFHSLASGGEVGNPALSRLRQCERGEWPGCESLGSRQIYRRIVALAGRLSGDLVTTSPLWNDLLCQGEYGDNDIVVPTNSALFSTEFLLDQQDFRGYAHASFPSVFSLFCNVRPASVPSAPKSITDFGSQSNSDLVIKVKSSLRRFLQAPPPLPSTFTLTVTKQGTGTGTVTSNLSGINCGATCTLSFTSGTSVVLTATPATGSSFTGWSGGGCSGAGACTLTMDQARTATATFESQAAIPIVYQPSNDIGVQDIWTTSIFSSAPGGGGPGGGLNNEQLRVGGWGDLYYSLIQFDLSQLPPVGLKVELQLYMPQVTGAGTTGLYVDRVTAFWDWRTQGTGQDRLRLWWADRPSAIQWIPSSLSAPTAGQWYVIDITTLYNAWKAGTYLNYGIQLRPVTNNNTWADFSSSNSVDALHRPRLVITPITTPLPPGYVVQGGLTWMPATLDLNWANANAYCTNTTINGQTGWRLPTRDEVYGFSSSFSPSGGFNNPMWTSPSLPSIWTSTPASGGSHYFANILTGFGFDVFDVNLLGVTCVR